MYGKTHRIGKATSIAKGIIMKLVILLDHFLITTNVETHFAQIMPYLHRSNRFLSRQFDFTSSSKWPHPRLNNWQDRSSQRHPSTSTTPFIHPTKAHGEWRTIRTFSWLFQTKCSQEEAEARFSRHAPDSSGSTWQMGSVAVPVPNGAASQRCCLFCSSWEQ